MQAAFMATIIAIKRYGTSIVMSLKRDRTRFLKRHGMLSIDPLFDAVIESIPPKEATLLTFGAAWDLDCSEELRGADIAVDPALIQQNLAKNPCELAGARDMARFDQLVNEPCGCL